MENVDKKYVSVEINRPPLNYTFQVDKSVNIDELEYDYDFEGFIDQHFYEEIHRYEISVKETPKPFTTFKEGRFTISQSSVEPEWFLYKTDEGFSCGDIVPTDTKSVIHYLPNYRDENDEYKSGGKTIKDSIEVFLSSTKEETKELWNKGDVKTLTNYFITNTWDTCSYREQEYEPMDKRSIQGIYDEKDNPVVIHLVDVETYQKEDGEGDELLK